MSELKEYTDTEILDWLQENYYVGEAEDVLGNPKTCWQFFTPQPDNGWKPLRERLTNAMRASK